MRIRITATKDIHPIRIICDAIKQNQSEVGERTALNHSTFGVMVGSSGKNTTSTLGKLVWYGT